ncbi:MAG: oligosaccharide flippase family protein [Ruminococcus flavefaciens]|nr:oligosaccharide flippase family protein [Ruminococcus flavefaciens]
MSTSRTKNASRNIFFGIVLKTYQIVLPFILRTIIVHELGTEYLGLNSLFTSVLQVLNLAELGVSSAMVFSMYKPVTENDATKICALLNLYKLYYRLIGLFILVVGLILTPFIPKLISGDIPNDMNVHVLYLINLTSTVFSYWLFAYKNSIFLAHQRTDISSKATIVTDTIKYGLQISFIYLTHNYYYYVLVLLAVQLLNNILIAILSNKLYPDYKPIGTLNSSEVMGIKQRIKDLFTSKLGGTIINSADTIVISSFLGLTTLAIYQNYYYILSAVMGFVSIIFNSITAGVGNSMILKSREENYHDFKVFTFLVCSVCGFCISCFVSLFQPFMTLWMGEDKLLPFLIVVLLVVYFWFYELIMAISVYKDAAGIWHSDRFRPLISGVVNLALNLVLVNFIHLYGIVLSSVLAMLFISLPWIIKNVFSEVFHFDIKEYCIMLLKYSAIVGVVTTICYYTSSFIHLESFLGFVVKLLFIIISTSGLLFLFLFKDKNYQAAYNLVLRMLRRS